MAKKQVLLVDDDDVFCEILSRSLARKGYQVVTAYDLVSAMMKCAAHVFDYVIVDLCIGDESGLAVVKKIKTEYPQVRVVMLTGYASIATAVEAIKLGAIHYLTKPAEIEDIVAAFSKEEGNEQVKLAETPLSVQRMEWEHIQKVLREYNGNISASARALGMHRRTLQRKLQKRPVKQ